MHIHYSHVHTKIHKYMHIDSCNVGAHMHAHSYTHARMFIHTCMLMHTHTHPSVSHPYYLCSSSTVENLATVLIGVSLWGNCCLKEKEPDFSPLTLICFFLKLKGIFSPLSKAL